MYVCMGTHTYIHTYVIMYIHTYVHTYILVMCDIHDMNIYHDINDGNMISRVNNKILLTLDDI